MIQVKILISVAIEQIINSLRPYCTFRNTESLYFPYTISIRYQFSSSNVWFNKIKDFLILFQYTKLIKLWFYTKTTLVTFYLNSEMYYSFIDEDLKYSK